MARRSHHWVALPDGTEFDEAWVRTEVFNVLVDFANDCDDDDLVEIPFDVSPEEDNDVPGFLLSVTSDDVHAEDVGTALSDAWY